MVRSGAVVYRVYDFRLGNNVRVTSQLVFTSRELVKKKAAPVGEWLATFTLFPLSPVQQALNHVSCINYFISKEIIRCSVQLINTAKPDKTDCGKNSSQNDATITRCQVTARDR